MSTDTTSAASPRHKATGSCHCGKVRYEAFLPAEPTVTKCNRTMCQKPGMLHLSISTSDFTLITPDSKRDLSDYQYRSKRCHRYFCNNCGVQIFAEGEFEYKGNQVPFFAVNANTIDQPQECIDLSTLKPAYIDGLHDNWIAGGQRDRPWPGGSY